MYIEYTDADHIMVSEVPLGGLILSILVSWWWTSCVIFRSKLKDMMPRLDNSVNVFFNKVFRLQRTALQTRYQNTMKHMIMIM